MALSKYWGNSQEAVLPSVLIEIYCKCTNLSYYTVKSSADPILYTNIRKCRAASFRADVQFLNNVKTCSLWFRSVIAVFEQRETTGDIPRLNATGGERVWFQASAQT